MPALNDVFVNFQPASWRGIVFPVTGEVSFSFEHDHAEHLYPDRDSGFVEATGRRPSRHTFRASFRNGIVSKDTDLLFPTRWRAFVKACADRTTGELVHPELGALKVKCKSHRTIWTSPEMKRDGCDVDVEFVETSDEEDELAAILAGQSMTDAIAIAGDLDERLGKMDPKPETPASLAPDLLTSMKRLNGLAQQARLGLGNIAGSIDAYAAGIDELRETIEANDNPSDYGILESLRRLFDATIELGLTLRPKAKPITSVLVKTETTLSTVAASFNNSLDDFLRLNPRLGSRTKLPANSEVFVYG